MVDLQVCRIRRDGRVVECDGLENRCGVSHPGFESQSLRRNEVTKEGLGFEGRE